MKIVTPEQMRDLERQASALGVSEESLMENAGLATARRIANLCEGIRGRRVVILVGAGNNGGDGLVAARFLADWGALVTLYMTSPQRRQDRFEECRARRIRVIEASEDPDNWQLGSYCELADVIVDSILGIGSNREINEPILSILRSIRKLTEKRFGTHLVAIDVPTGVDSDTGFCTEDVFPATLTLALGAPKIGLFRFPGASFSGRVETLSIGIPNDLYGNFPVDLMDPVLASSCLPPRPRNAHKGSFGTLLVVGGSEAFIGAPILSSAAGYRSGVGLVELAAPRIVQQIAGHKLLEQIHTPLGNEGNGTLDSSSSGLVCERLTAASAGVIGPGLGASEAVRGFLSSLLLERPPANTPIVLDADALNILSSYPNWYERITNPTVLTPHPGEMARLLNASVDEIQADRLGTAIRSANRWNKIVVLKGAHTVVAAPSGNSAISPFATPLLATAGTGDVLAGLIGGLIAQGAEPYAAAVAGVYIHASSGRSYEGVFGDQGLLASDLLERIPVELNKLRILKK